MPADKQLLMFRADWDIATKFGSYWVGAAKSVLYDKGMLVTDLSAGLATKDELVRALNEVDPCTFWAMGHGIETQFAGQDNYVILEKGVDESLMIGRVVHLTSCLTGAETGLLESLFKAGAKACFGYSVELIVGVETDNFPMTPNNEATKSLMKPDVAIELALADGKTAKEAFDKSDEVADSEIEYWRDSGHPDSDLLIFCHLHNKNGKALYGEGDTIIRDRGEVNWNAAQVIISALTLAVSVATIVVMKPGGA